MITGVSDTNGIAALILTSGVVEGRIPKARDHVLHVRWAVSDRVQWPSPKVQSNKPCRNQNPKYRHFERNRRTEPQPK